jgi:dipeptidyl aminopeptidase/acylaminoacyl peptidase
MRLRSAVPLCCAAVVVLAGCQRRYSAPECTISRPAPAAERGGGGEGKGEAPFVARALAPAESHPFSVRDLLDMVRVGDPAVSPDGSKVLYTLRTTDLDNNRGRKDIWLVGLDGTPPRQVTHGAENEDAPRWLPDGRGFLYLQKHAGSAQVWQGSVDGAAPAKVTDLPVDVGSFTLSADGRLLAFSAEVYPDCARDRVLACTAERLAAREDRSRGTAQLHRRLFVRHWDAWKDDRRSHLFVQPVDGSAPPVDVSHALDADVPSKPFGDADEYVFTPDGKEIVFAARVAGKTEPWSTNFDLFVAPVDGAAAPRNLTPDNPAWDTGPVFSPDGETLAYRAMTRPGYEADRWRVMTRTWPEGQAKELAPTWDRSPDELLFSADGETLYATAQDLGQTPLFALDLAGGAPRALVAEGAVSHLRRAGARVVFLHNSLASPDELESVDAGGGDPKAHTAVNAGRLKKIRTGEAERLSFVGADKHTVHGWIYKPVDFDPTKTYPIAFLIHGGPQGSFGNRWNYRWHPQTYAGAGYAVITIDFHGSTGYGQAFTDAIQDDWGGRPLVDLKAGLAAALAGRPWLDGGRACALGASYGGFMVNWIASQWKDGFKCLVNHDGVFDNRMMYYSTEELWFSEWEHAGPYWQQTARHERHNPVNHVDQWSLPMLVIHGGLDFRIPDTQGIATFTALQRRGVPSQFLHFPDENHWVLKPANSLVWHDTVIGWLDTWLKAG